MQNIRLFLGFILFLTLVISSASAEQSLEAGVPNTISCTIQVYGGPGQVGGENTMRAQLRLSAGGYVETVTASNPTDSVFDSRYDGQIVEQYYLENGRYSVVAKYVRSFPSSTETVIREFKFNSDFTGGTVTVENELVDMQSCQPIWD